MVTQRTRRKSTRKRARKSSLKRSKKTKEEKIWKWWKGKKRKRSRSKLKWRSLEHNGPVFAPAYQRVPRNVKLYYNGRPAKLSKYAEEVAGFYGKMLDDAYTKKKTFNKNFFNDWRQVMNKKERNIIKDFKKCDFEDFYDFYKEEAELRKQMSKKEKKKLKKEKEALTEKYGYCYVDGRRQKIGNFRLEPPGLFRGRGRHPKMGKLKKRIEAEDVIINIGEDAPVPRPPPRHKWKEIIHDRTLAWLACWIDNISDTTKYIMLNPSSKIKGEKDIEKYETARKLKRHIRQIRKKYMRDLNSSDMQVKQRAVALYFIDRLALRTGNEKDKDSADTVGCCSLRVEHLRLDEGNRGEECIIHFDFLGKDCIPYKNSVPVDDRVFDNLELFMEDKMRGCYIFDELNPMMLNRYLHEQMEGLTVKVFRTYYSSKELEDQLKRLTKKRMSLEEKLLVYNTANRAAAILCNHHRAIPKTFAKSMRNIESKIKRKLKEVQKLVKKVKRDHDISSDEDINDYNIDCKEMKKISTIKKQIEKLQIRATVKADNKDIALSTSKMNYLDPRISVAWCKKWNVPIEKVYSKAQRERFQWAIETTNKKFKF